MRHLATILVLAVFALTDLRAQAEVDVQLVRVEAHEAFAEIAIDAGISLTVAPDVRGSVTVVLHRVTWQHALEVVARAVGASVALDSKSGVHSIRRDPAATAGASGEAVRGGTKIVAERDLLRGIPATREDGAVNAVVEIPTGTTAKWEVDESDGSLRWEIRDGAPRVVRFLGYPGNYGMIPRTLLAQSAGGDGDPLDVIVLGDPLPRGTVVPVRLIGLLELRDRGERDDKLIAVREGTPFSKVTGLDQLRREFVGVVEILETWFRSYKGPGKIESQGYRDAAAARELLRVAKEAFGRVEAEGRSGK